MSIKKIVIPKTDKGNDASDHRGEPDYEKKLKEEIDNANPITVPGAAPGRKSSVEIMNEQYAIAVFGNKTLIVERVSDRITGFIQDRFLTTENLQKLLKNKWAFDQDGKSIVHEYGKTKKRVKRFDHWMDSPERNTYTTVYFKPEPNTYAADLVGFPEGYHYNQWKGLHIKPGKGDCSRITEHIREIWCAGKDELFDYTWNWLARMMQRPHERGETAIILRSGQGTGKNIIVDIFVEYFGIHGLMVSSPQQLIGTFNGHLRLIVFCFANEAVWGGDKKSEGILKSFITDETRTTEEKYLPPVTEYNYMHLLLATNSDWAAPMDLDDRRYLVLDVVESKKGDSEYFRELKREIDNGGKAALLDALLNTDVSNFDHRTLPTNQGFSKLTDQLKTADSVIRWWYQCLDEGEISSDESILDASKDWANDQITVDKKELYASYLLYCNVHKILRIEDMALLMRSLYQRFNFPGTKTFDQIRVKKIRKIIIPSLSIARDLFSLAARNQEIEWD